MPVARLGFTIDPTGAVSGSKQGQAAIDGMAASAKRAESSMAGASAAIAQTTSATERSRFVTEAEIKALVRQQQEISRAENARRRAENTLRSYEAAQKQQVATEQKMQVQQAATTAAADKSVDGFAKVRGSLTALATSATGVSGPLGSVVSVLTNLAAGSTVTVGVVAAAGIIGVAYDQLTKKTQAMQKAQDEALKSIEALAKAERLGVGGELATQIGLATANIAKLRAERDALTRQSGSAFGGAGPVDRGTGQRSAAAIKAELDKRNLEIAAAERELVRIINETNREQSSARSKGLAELIAGNAATVGEQKDAATRLKNLQGQLAESIRVGGDPAERARLITDIKALNAALNPSTVKEQKAETKLFNEQLARSVDRFEEAAKSRAKLNQVFKDGQKALRDTSEAQKLLKTQQDINAAADAEQARVLEEKRKKLELVRQAMAALYGLGPDVTLDNLADAKGITDEWIESLQGVVGIVQLIASAFGEAGREAAQIGNAAQSLLSGVGAAGRLTGRDGKTSIGLGKALSGSEGAGAFASGLSVVGQYAGAAIALADAFGLFDDAAKKAREGQLAYTKALEEYAIVQRTSLEQAIKDDIAKANQTAQGAFAASGATGSISFKSGDDLQRTIAELRNGPKEFQKLADSLDVLLVQVRKNEAAIRAEAAARLQAATEDLAVRRLIAAGQTEAAEAERLRLAQVREIAAAEKEFGKDSPYLDELKKVQEAEKAAADAARELAAAEKQLQQARQAQAFGADLRARGQALSGDDRGAAITRLGISQAGELQAAEALLKAGTITQEMFDELARVLGGELAKAIEDLDKAAQDAAKAIEKEKENKRDELAVRALIATGDEAGAARMRREIANRHELEGVTDEALRAEILRVQGLEALAIALAEAARLEQERAAQNDDINRRLIDAYRVLDPVKAAELEQIREQIEREELLRGAVDEATRARYEELFAIEDQAKAVKKLADEQRAAAEAAEKLANLTATVEEEYLRATGRGFDADVKALERRRDDRLEEAKKAGASEETIRQIKAIFEANLQTLIARTIESATPGGSGTKSGTQAAEMEFQQRAISRSISGLEAIRLIDVGLSQLAVLRQIAANTSGGAGGGVNVTVQGGTFLGGNSSPGNGMDVAGAVMPLIDEALGRRVGVDRRLAGITTL